MPSMPTWIFLRNSQRTSSSMTSSRSRSRKLAGRQSQPAKTLCLPRPSGKRPWVIEVDQRRGSRCTRIQSRSDAQASGHPFVVRQFDSQVAQLTGIDCAWRIRHQIHAAIVLWECDDVANVLFAADQHDEPIEAERDPAVRRRAEPQRSEQMPELRLLTFRPDAECFEHFFLQLRLVNPDASAADLDAV